MGRVEQELEAQIAQVLAAGRAFYGWGQPQS
jgi:hypothetical protein